MALAGCSGTGDEQTPSGATTERPASATTTAAAAPTPSPQQRTPEQQFIDAVEDAGIVPQHASAPAAVELALAICVAYGAGQSTPEVMATLAGGSLSLGQMLDLEQAATRFYCPRYHVPSP
ncbi:DUF732 domain-containing protein [Geodermatophilus marinus]|uniref:DUF732 domain-containing protein n=1 Tax=Geodermatophilus sp. LHW52908 TaxID=2303986 RepID=UPI001314C836|nr:DUF732 domain-containing protein [Geodermatophilus sp. LHW52908]